MKIVTRFALVLLIGFIAFACTPPDNSAELAEIGQQQKQILAKLNALEKKLDRPAAPAAPPPRPSGPDPERKYDLPIGASDVKGAKDGSITIMEFSDYQCPFCARVEPLIAEALAAYPTQAHFVYKHFPLESIHPHAMGASQAAIAAQKQGKFWEMHELLFANQRALQPEKLIEYAQQLELDIDKFKEDMNSDAVKQAVREDMRLASTVGVRGTPTIFVNGKVLRNRSIQGFKEMIDPILAAAAKG
jgi:protein-disulfide isomerase